MSLLTKAGWQVLEDNTWNVKSLACYVSRGDADLGNARNIAFIVRGVVHLHLLVASWSLSWQSHLAGFLITDIFVVLTAKKLHVLASKKKIEFMSAFKKVPRL